jgi:hypothetical protein
MHHVPRQRSVPEYAVSHVPVHSHCVADLVSTPPWLHAPGGGLHVSQCSPTQGVGQVHLHVSALKLAPFLQLAAVYRQVLQFGPPQRGLAEPSASLQLRQVHCDVVA